MKKVTIFVKKCAVTFSAMTVFFCVTPCVFADVNSVVEIDIASKQAGLALMELSKKTGSQIVLAQGLGNGIELPAIKGRYSLNDALQEMLSGTGLMYEFVSDDSVLITQEVNADKRGKEGTSNQTIEEMIVTAQKRQQSVQDVPIAISALSADMMERRGIESPEDIQFSTPNLNLGQQAGNGYSNVVATIRGVGTVNALLDPGVPMHIDGHYIQATAFLGRDLLDVERVEVLRGPQGTLYGRNAIGGSINVITKRPTDEFEGKFSLDVGNYDKRLVTGVLNVPLSDKLRARIAVSDEKRDGYTKNVSGMADEDLDNSNYTYVRGSVEYDLTDNVQVYMSAYSYDADFRTLPFRRINPYPVLGEGADVFAQFLIDNGSGPNPTATDPFAVSLNEKMGMTDTAEGASLDVFWNLDDFQIAYLASYNDSATHRYGDLDGSFAVTFSNNARMLNETFSQELQFISDGDGRLKWQSGLYYYRQKSSAPASGRYEDLDILIPSWGIPYYVFTENYPATVTSYGVYGQFEYSITDQLELVVGGRFTQDKKEQTGMLGLNFATGTDELIFSSVMLDDSWAQFTYRAGFNYYMTDEAMFYVNYATGYRAGGVFIVTTYEPEYVNVIESGLKSQWLEQRLQLNAAAFYSSYEDKQEIVQVLKPDGELSPGGKVANVPNTKIYGLEAELTVLVSSDFSLNGALTWQESMYDGLTIADAVSPTGFQDITGNRLANSATWRLYLGGEYNWSLGSSGNISARLDVSYVGDQEGTIFNHIQSRIPSYYRTNGRIRWENTDGDWRAEFYVQNLLDEASLVGKAYVYWPGAGSPIYGSYLPPRTYGFKLTHNF